jgi:hypothetical protein
LRDALLILRVGLVAESGRVVLCVFDANRMFVTRFFHETVATVNVRAAGACADCS